MIANMSDYDLLEVGTIVVIVNDLRSHLLLYYIK